jgi:hypothetical protein
MLGHPILYTPPLIGELNRSNNHGHGVATKSDRRNRIEQPFVGGIYDNMKTAVETVFVGKSRLYNRRFPQMCS